jgi:hypothetical protein
MMTIKKTTRFKRECKIAMRRGCNPEVFENRHTFGFVLIPRGVSYIGAPLYYY